MSWTFTYTTSDGVTHTKTIGSSATAEEQTNAIREVLAELKEAGGGTITLAAATYSLVPGATADAGCLGREMRAGSGHHVRIAKVSGGVRPAGLASRGELIHGPR